MSERLRYFASELLERSGSVVELIDPDGMEVLIPPDVRTTLLLPEMARLGFSSELPEGAQRVGLESDWLERFQGLLGNHGRWVRRRWASKLSPPSNPEKILEHGFFLNNAVFRLEKVHPAWTRYLIMVFRFTALSEEKREGVLRIGINMANGATMDNFLDNLWPELFMEEPEILGPNEGDLPVIEGLPEMWESQKITTVMHRSLPPRVEQNLGRFIQGLKRRQERDSERLHGYFSDMQQEILARMAKDAKGAKEKTPDDSDKYKLRLDSIEREYNSKIVDLRQKYALNVETTFIQGMVLEMPIFRLNLLLRRKKGERRIHLDWNPMVRKLETPPCEYSFTWTQIRTVCDDALHLVSPDAHSGCPQCGKPFCRACYGEKCPKCGQKNPTMVSA